MDSQESLNRAGASQESVQTLVGRPKPPQWSSSYSHGSQHDFPSQTSHLIPSAPARRQQKETKKWSAFWKNAGLSFISFRMYSRREKRELKKPIVEKSLKLAIIRSWIHLVPVCAASYIVAINLWGFFLGAHLAGGSTLFWGEFEILLLQIAAKILELLIIASLGKIVITVMRHELIHSDDGLPFGMLVARGSFADLSYYWSPEFVASIRAFKSRWKKAWIALLLLTAGVISTFAGPATAVLIIPVDRQNWPAASMHYYLNGTNATLWPASLDLDVIDLGGQNCTDPDPTTIFTISQSNLTCPWSGYSLLYNQWKPDNLDGRMGWGNITITDGIVIRTLKGQRNNIEQGETWTQGVSLAVGALSTMMTAVFTSAIFNAPDKSKLKYLNIHNRDVDSDRSSSVSWVPVARVACFFKEGLNVSSSPQTIQYPYLPQFQAQGNATYPLLTSFPSTSEHIQTQWLPSSLATVLNDSVTLSDGSQTNELNSAYLNIQLPTSNETELPSIYACSVDARWALAKNIAMEMGVNTRPGQMVSSPVSRRKPDPGNRLPADIQFLPIDDGNWRTVQLGPDWLDLLAPPLNNTNATAYTSLSMMLEGLFGTEDSSNGDWWIDYKPSVESVIATVVVDGMSRIGYFGNPDSYVSGDWPQIPSSEWSTDDFLNSLLQNTAQAPWPYNEGAGPFQWSATVGGLAYYADSVSLYLAIAVLLAYDLLAVSHMLYMWVTRTSSDAWESLAELLALAWASAIPSTGNLRQNVSAGIRQSNTFATMAVVRARPDYDNDTVEAVGDAEAYESAELLVTDGEMRNRWKRIRNNAIY